jgi:site-specific DNA recombinase
MVATQRDHDHHVGPQEDTAMKVGLYARVSSDRQAERGTIQDQLTYLRDYCRLNDLTIAGEYPDEAESGPVPLAERPQGARLLRDARLKRFEKVLVYKWDRLARDLYELLTAERTLQALGIGLESVTERLDTSTDAGRMAFQIMGAVAENERKTILQRTYNGRIRMAKAGGWVGGPPPYGYQVVDGRLAPYEPEAAVIRALFENLASGGTMRAEGKRLNESGVFGRMGKPWTESRLTKVIHSTTYIGQHVYRGRDGTFTRDVPPLVDRETWERAHAQLRANSVQRPNKRFYLLRGLIRCRNCGSRYIGAKRAHGTKLHYRCLLSMRGGPRRCRSANINAPALEDYVWKQTKALLDNPLWIIHEAQGKLATLRQQDRDRDERKSALQRALGEQEAAKQRILRLVRLGKVSDREAEAELDAINTETNRINGELLALDTEHDLAGTFKDRLMRLTVGVKRLAQRVDPDNLEDRHRAVNLLLSGIEVETIGQGRERRVKLTFRWLGTDPSDLYDLNEIEDAEGLPEGVKVSRLKDALTRGGDLPGLWKDYDPAELASPEDGEGDVSTR